jgi:hypothetical protein
MKLLKLTLLILNILIFSNIKAVTCDAITGSWNSASTWSCGRVPQGGDIINIPVGVTVNNIPSNFVISGSSITINVYGVLDFGNSGKLTLPTGSVVNVKLGGLLKKGSGSGNNNIIDIGDDIVWNASCGNIIGVASLVGGVSLCIVLPLDIIYFNVISDNEKNILKFRFNQRGNIKNLVIEKSYDLNNWEVVNIFENVRNYDYEFIHIDYSENINIYYRIKQVDNNNDFFYTKVEVVSKVLVKKYSISVDNNRLSFKIENGVVLKIYNYNGIFIGLYTKSDEIFLDNGVYIISIIDNNRVNYEKILIN